MFCPYCGAENPDDAKFCAVCGNRIDEDPYDLDEAAPSGSAEWEEGGSSDGSERRGRNWNRILIIVVILAAAAVALAVILPRVFSGSSSKDEITAESAVEDIAPESREEAAGEEDAEAESIEESVETESIVEDAAEDTEEAPAQESDSAVAAAEEDLTDLAPAEGDSADSGQQGSGSEILTGAKDRAEYSIQSIQDAETDENGNVVVETAYDLVVLSGDDGVNQKINASLEQDYEAFLASEPAYGTDTTEANEEPVVRTVEADVVYDKNSVLSILNTTETETGDAAEPQEGCYGLNYSLETGEQVGIRELTGLSDEEILDEVRTALRQADQASGYTGDAEGKINALSVDEIGGSEFPFIVEGGEIVIVVPSGVLGSGLGNFKVPTTIYITTMSYDEYTADYIFPDSNSRYLTRDDLVGLSKEELRLARNEIFARHGRLYRDENLSAYFSSKSWYNGTAYEEDFDMDVFNDYEWKNLELLNAYDKEMGYQ